MEISENNPLTTLVSILTKGTFNQETITSTILGRKITTEEAEYCLDKMAAYIAYDSIVKFLEKDIDYIGDEVCGLIKNLWLAKKEIIPAFKEQINIIIKDLAERNLCPKWINGNNKSREI